MTSHIWTPLMDRDLFSMAKNMKVFSGVTSRDHDFIFVGPRGVCTTYTKITNAVNRQVGPDALHAGSHLNPITNSQVILIQS